MKKFVSVLVALISLICLSFACLGCGENEEGGRFYNLMVAYEQGWIDETDLKSIACSYYDWRGFEENPYSGQFNSTEKLSTKIRNELIEKFDSTAEDVKIIKCFGTYDGNVAVTLGYESIDYESFEADDCTVYGIVFPDFRYVIKIYHCPEQKDKSLKVSGKLYGLKEAYESGLLDADDLKSISCCCYDCFSNEENPYTGLYSEPTERLSREKKNELKQAYLEQIDEYPDGELDGVILHRYYGLYKGYTVVSMTGYNCGYPSNFDGTEIGGVSFCGTAWMTIFVYKA